ncbi:recombinase family protein [Alloscardovia omnicolens]|nr:recombinase family protein [Alloscardovia omnicolens]MDK6663623.1 recombinase family protein [Alloscardovia omnicolens]MDK7747978.1 recombinase family protein [Alloscardovia omnicolens]
MIESSYIKSQCYTLAFQLVMKIETVARVIVLSIKKHFRKICKRKKLINIRHYIDDDESGRFFDRSAYTQMISDVEQGKIGIVIMKDMTR